MQIEISRGGVALIPTPPGARARQMHRMIRTLSTSFAVFVVVQTVALYALDALL